MEITNLLDLEIARLWGLSFPEDEFIHLFSRICYLLLENPLHTRDKNICEAIFHILGILVSKYNQALGVTTTIVHMLLNLPHLVSSFADLMSVLKHQFENVSVLSEILREIARMDGSEFMRNTEGAKSIHSFLITCSELIPDAVLGLMPILLPQLDCESHFLRNSILVVIGNLISLSLNPKIALESSPPNPSDPACDQPSPPEPASCKALREAYLDILMERIHDASSYVRSRVLQVWCSLCREKAIPLVRFHAIVALCIERLEDKAAAVRKSSLTLLGSFLEFNPYGSKLQMHHFHAELMREEKKLNHLLQSASLPEIQILEQHEKDPKSCVENLLHQLKNLTVDEIPQESLDAIARQKAIVQYFYDAYKFTTCIQEALPTLSQLLGSSTVSDVKEAINFFIIAHDFSIENVEKLGIRKMLAIVWSKSEGLQEILIHSFHALYFDPQKLGKDPTDKLYAVTVVRSLISLTFGASLGELTSLGALLHEMTKMGYMTPNILRVLWDVFADKLTSVSIEHRRGAIMILSMCASADAALIRSRVQLLIQVGLEPFF
eukprot:Sdes_comp20649_c0_seq1m15928